MKLILPILAALSALSSAATLSFQPLTTVTGVSFQAVLSASENGTVITIQNTGSEGVAANIYFQTEAPNLDLTVQSGVSFQLGGSPPLLPGSTMDPAFRWSAISPAPQNGINPGDSITFLLNGTSYETASQAFESGEWKIGLHVLSVGPDSISVSMESVPEPSTTLVALLGMPLLFRRKR